MSLPVLQIRKLSVRRIKKKKKKVSNVKVIKSRLKFKFINIKTVPLPYTINVLCYPCFYYQIISSAFIEYFNIFTFCY